MKNITKTPFIFLIGVMFSNKLLLTQFLYSSRTFFSCFVAWFNFVLSPGTRVNFLPIFIQGGNKFYFRGFKILIYILTYKVSIVTKRCNYKINLSFWIETVWCSNVVNVLYMTIINFSSESSPEVVCPFWQWIKRRQQ